MHYAQPLLREASQLAQEMDTAMPARQRQWLGLQMLEGDICIALMLVTQQIN